MIASFLVTALLAGIGVALLAGPLGSFVVWRRMAYFGDTLAHSALLGIALGLLFSVNSYLTIIVVCSALALLLVALQSYRGLSTDTLLGILAHTSLALGVITVSLLGDSRVDLFAYLFGDLLASTWQDVAMVYCVCAAVFAVLAVMWRQLLSVTVHADLAQVEGVNVPLMQIVLSLLLALVIAITMKVTGVLLLTALLIIPAAASRRLANTPEQMVLGASLLGIVAVVLGVGASVWLDTPTGPSIVVASSGLFLLSLLKRE